MNVNDNNTVGSYRKSKSYNLVPSVSYSFVQCLGEFLMARLSGRPAQETKINTNIK